MTGAAVHPLLMGLLRGSDPGTLLPLAPEERDWGEIVRDAETHGLTAFLYRWLRRSEVGRRISPEPATRLEGQYFALAARSMLLADELRAVLQAFEEGEVPCAPLRGLALAERLHGDITARPMGDVDLLVRKEDLSRVAALLRDLGFREIDRRAGFARAFSYTLEFFKDRHGWLVVEPHWTLAYPPFAHRLDMDAVWARCRRGRVLGADAWLLDQGDLLLHLCLHLIHRDGTAPLLWPYEIDRLIRLEGEGLDWPGVADLAREAGLESVLRQCLRTVKRLFATPIPDQVLAPPAQASPRSVQGRLHRLLGAPAGVDGKESLALLFTLNGFRPRLRYAVALLFPSAEFMRLQYGLTHTRQLAPAYIRRCGRLGWEGFKGIVKLLVIP